MVLCAYQNTVYDDLGEVEKVSTLVTIDDIRRLGRLILKANQQNHLCVALAHRHFNLADTEVMLETQDGGTRIAKPVDIDTLASLNVHPSIISCTKDGKWYPVQYAEGKNDFLGICENAEFLESVADFLVENKLHDKLVLTARGSDFEGLGDVVGLELNYQDTRVSEIRPCSMSEIRPDAIKTTYSFTDDPEGHIETCCSVCALHRSKIGH